MTDKKISQLDNGTPLQVNDLFVVARAGQDYKIPASQLKVFTTTTQEIPTGDIDGINTEFTISETPISETQNLYLNGIFQTEVSDYTLSGTTITFVTAPQTGDELTITYQY